MITYLELLLMIRDGRRPKAIKFGSRIYRWKTEDNSYKDGQFFLSDAISENFFDIDLVSERCIEIIEK